MRKTWTSDVCGLLTGMWATIVLAGFVLGVLTKSIVLPSTPVLQPGNGGSLDSTEHRSDVCARGSEPPSPDLH